MVQCFFDIDVGDSAAHAEEVAAHKLAQDFFAHLAPQVLSAPGQGRTAPAAAGGRAVWHLQTCPVGLR